MNFLTETGIILGNNKDEWFPKTMKIIQGTTGSVDFPAEELIKFHQDNPGQVYALAHTHPPKFYRLSRRDELTLKSWAFAFYPYPIRMITVAQVDEDIFRINTYLAHLESKQSWKQRGLKDTRKFEIIQEEEEIFCLGKEEKTNASWKTLIIRKSYE